NESVSVNARAVTLYTNPNSACVLALAPTASDALKVSGAASIDLVDCDTASNSMAADAFDMYGSSRYATRCLHTVGHAQSTAGLTLTGCPSVDELASITPDPYANVPEPAVEGPCYGKNVGSPVTSTVVTATTSHSSYLESGLRSMRFCNGLMLKGDVHFDPGLYIIERNNFTVNGGANITGDNVIFYFANGATSHLNGSAVLDLSPPTSGIYSGILFFGQRNDTSISHIVNGASGTSFDGAIYFPGQKITYNGGGVAAGGCTQIIGYMVEFNGDSGVSLDCEGVGVTNIDVAGTVEIVE
ncbi:MAG: pilus assembly protein TadG-related protein, partial [Alphaproteobacteria bacterium]